MRTTLDLDTTALEAVRQLAAHRSESLGKVVSDLILKGLQQERSPATRRKAGLPVFAAGTRPITLEDVKLAEDME